MCSIDRDQLSYDTLYKYESHVDMYVDTTLTFSHHKRQDTRQLMWGGFGQ